jgi:hypothetical protein
MRLRDFFNFNPPLPIEAIQAYYDRLPEGVRVSWFRDGDFIVGEVETNGKSFTTQGINADDFIDMVNDVILVMERIPQKDIDFMRQYKAYSPPADELAKLKNLNINSAFISLKKSKEIPQLA